MGKTEPESPRRPHIDPETLAFIQRSLGRQPLREIELELESLPQEEPDLHAEEMDADDEAN